MNILKMCQYWIFTFKDTIYILIRVWSLEKLTWWLWSLWWLSIMIIIIFMMIMMIMMTALRLLDVICDDSRRQQQQNSCLLQAQNPFWWSWSEYLIALPKWLIIKTHFSLASLFQPGQIYFVFGLFSCTVGIDVSQEVALAHFKRLSICHPLQCLLSISVLVRLDVHQIVCYHYFDQWSSPTIRGQRSEWSSWWPWSCPWPWCKWQKRWTDPQCLLPLPPSSCKNRFYARQGKNAMFCCTTREDSDDFEFSKLF